MPDRPFETFEQESQLRTGPDVDHPGHGEELKRAYKTFDPDHPPVARDRSTNIPSRYLKKWQPQHSQVRTSEQDPIYQELKKREDI